MNTQNPIQSTHWQLAPDTDTKSVVEGIDDIHLCIANILNTLKGTDILRPEFGSDHFQYIDYPFDEAVPNFVREITQALQRWEKRIDVQEIIVDGEAPRFLFTVCWQLTDDVYREIYQTKVQT